jgi:integrase
MAQYSRKLKKGIRWYYKFDFMGKTYFSACIYVSKGEAKKAETAKYEEVSLKERSPELFVESHISLLEAINSRLDSLQVKRTIRYYKENKAYYKILIERLGDLNINAIKKTDINSLLLDTSKKAQEAGDDNYKVNSMLRVYKALFNHAIEEFDLNIKNPCIGIKPFSIKRKLKYIPPDSHIEAVLSLCDKEEKLLITFVMETGCRINEALRVTGTDILPEYIILYTRKSKHSDLVPRKVPHPGCLKGIIIDMEERLFSRWITYPKFIEDKVKQLAQKSWCWHNLRHRKASLMSKEGKPLFDIMSLLGHSNLSTTQGYLQTIL